MGWLSTLFGTKNPRAVASPKVHRRIQWREGSYPTCAVGESHYQDALSWICGGHNRHGYEMPCEAELIPEPTNSYDVNAVRVAVHGRTVGYLSREDAIRFHEEMAVAGHAREGARCAALINGGWRTNQYDEGNFGIRLGIPQRGRFQVA